MTKTSRRNSQGKGMRNRINDEWRKIDEKGAGELKKTMEIFSKKLQKIMDQITFSFQSSTHFSIQGIRLITTNSRANLAVIAISFSPSLNVFGVDSDRPKAASFVASDSEDGGRGSRGSGVGTGTGGTGGDGNIRERR